MSSEKHCITISSEKADELAVDVDEWLDSSPSDMRIISTNYTVTRIGAWDAPEGESLYHSVLIIYEYPK